MKTLYDLQQFHKMNHSKFLLSICGDHYEVEGGFLGITNLMERISLIDNHPTTDDLFRVFCTNESNTYEKLYLDNKGNISLEIIIILKQI